MKDFQILYRHEILKELNNSERKADEVESKWPASLPVGIVNWSSVINKGHNILWYIINETSKESSWIRRLYIEQKVGVAPG